MYNALMDGVSVIEADLHGFLLYNKWFTFVCHIVLSLHWQKVKPVSTRTAIPNCPCFSVQLYIKI